MTKHTAWRAGLLAAVGLGITAGLTSQQGTGTAGTEGAGKHWSLAWSDEFNGPDGSLPDPAKWTMVTGGSGYGNAELESYTDRAVNAHQEGGYLVITARKEALTGPDGIPREYTSARLQSKDHFETQYGRVEARIKIPGGQGLWPAFWMLGTNVDHESWPACGEIDIMENVGKEPGKVHGTLHGPGYSGEYALTGGYSLPAGERFSDGFHIFAVEWTAEQLQFSVDGHPFETQNIDNIPSYKRWVFNHPYFVLLDLAVGGTWPGSPDEKTVFPAKMLVDYVRVYKPVETALQAPKR